MPPPTPENIRAVAYRSSFDCARDVAMLNADDAILPECLEKLNSWSVPAIDLKGGELIGLGLPAGPLVARTLRAIEAHWISEDFPPRARQMEIARQAVAEALSAAKKA
jgi:poly(A) polymerase